MPYSLTLSAGNILYRGWEVKGCQSGIGGMILTGKIRSSSRSPMPVLLCPLQIPHWRGRDQTRTSAVTGGRLRMVQKTFMCLVELRSCDLSEGTFIASGWVQNLATLCQSWHFRRSLPIASWYVVTYIIVLAKTVPTFLLLSLLCFGLLLFLLRFAISPSSNIIFSILIFSRF